MTRLSITRTVSVSLRTLFERGPALLTLFTFVGVLAYLGWSQATAIGWRAEAIIAIGALLAWKATEIISLNTLIESNTKIELSSMYLTDYRGLAWTTASLIAGTAAFSALILLCASLFLIPFAYNGVDRLILLSTTPISLTVTDVYVLFVQLQSLLLTLYIGARLMLFPAYVAVESTTFMAGMHRSVNATAGHMAQLVPIMLLTAATPVLAAFGGIKANTMITPHVNAVATIPYVQPVLTGGIYTAFVGLGILTGLSLLATTYSALRER